MADRWLVDVAGIEPATPCLQSNFRKAKQLARLAFNYVVVSDFLRCLAGFVPRLFPNFSRPAPLAFRAKGSILARSVTREPIPVSPNLRPDGFDHRDSLFPRDRHQQHRTPNDERDRTEPEIPDSGNSKVCTTMTEPSPRSAQAAYAIRLRCKDTDCAQPANRKTYQDWDAGVRLVLGPQKSAIGIIPA